MLITKKHIIQHTTSFAFPKDVWTITNATNNEVYVLMQPLNGTVANPAALSQEILDAGYTITKNTFNSGLAISLEKGNEFKTLIQTTPEGFFQVYLYWTAEVIN